MRRLLPLLVKSTAIPVGLPALIVPALVTVPIPSTKIPVPPVIVPVLLLITAPPFTKSTPLELELEVGAVIVPKLVTVSVAYI